MHTGAGPVHPTPPHPTPPHPTPPHPTPTQPSSYTRTQVLEGFKSGRFNCLVATSIGEEGLDIPQVCMCVCVGGYLVEIVFAWHQVLHLLHLMWTADIRSGSGLVLGLG